MHPTRVSFWLFKPTFSFKAFSYFTFSSFCRNFVGKADNEHNGTIKREGSLFFGDERSLSKIVQTWKTKKNEDGVRVTFAKMHFPLEREISEQKSARYYSILQISSYYRSIICTHLRYWYIQWKKGDKYHSLVSLQPLVVPHSFFVGIVKVRQIFCLDFHRLRVNSNWLMSQVYDSDSSGP